MPQSEKSMAAPHLNAVLFFMINYIKILGERHSGTNLLQKIICDNFQVRSLGKYGWKHARWNIDTAGNEIELYYNARGRAKYPISAFHNVLVLVISRNIFTWINSIHKSPYHIISLSLRKRSLKNFISFRLFSLMRGDYRPNASVIFKNIFSLRKEKHLAWLNLQNHLPHVAYIKYEDLCDNPEKIVRDLAKKYNLALKNNNAITLSSLTGPYFMPNLHYRHTSLDSEIINAVTRHIDPDLEAMLGYTTTSPDTALSPSPKIASNHPEVLIPYSRSIIWPIIRVKGQFLNNQKHGRWSIEIFGIHVKTFFYYENDEYYVHGNIKRKTLSKNGKIISATYHENGRIKKIETYEKHATDWNG